MQPRWTLTKPSAEVGYWRIGDMSFAMRFRPRWITRVLCRLLLEWKWEDAKP